MISWKLFYGVNYVFHDNNSINDHVANISLHLIPMKLQKPLRGDTNERHYRKYHKQEGQFFIIIMCINVFLCIRNTTFVIWNADLKVEWKARIHFFIFTLDYHPQLIFKYIVIL